jgi:hypothetical protein
MQVKAVTAVSSRSLYVYSLHASCQFLPRVGSQNALFPSSDLDRAQTVGLSIYHNLLVDGRRT